MVCGILLEFSFGNIHNQMIMYKLKQSHTLKVFTDCLNELPHQAEVRRTALRIAPALSDCLMSDYFQTSIFYEHIYSFNLCPPTAMSQSRGAHGLLQYD